MVIKEGTLNSSRLFLWTTPAYARIGILKRIQPARYNKVVAFEYHVDIVPLTTDRKSI